MKRARSGTQNPFSSDVAVRYVFDIVYKAITGYLICIDKQIMGWILWR